MTININKLAKLHYRYLVDRIKKVSMVPNMKKYNDLDEVIEEFRCFAKWIKDNKSSQDESEGGCPSASEIKERIKNMNNGDPEAKMCKIGQGSEMDALINLCHSYYNNNPPIKVTDDYLLKLGKVFSGEEILMMLSRKILTI